MKRIISVLLCTVMITVGISAFADEGINLDDYSFQQLIALRQQIDSKLIQITTNIDHSDYALDGFVYVSNGSEVRINLYEGSNPEVIVPSEIEGLPVTQIHQNAFQNNTVITSVTLPEGMTEIPSQFFSGCKKLRSVTMPSTLTTIGWNAFGDISSFRDIIFHEGIIEIKDVAFMRSGISGVIILPSSLTILGSNAFNNCKNLTGIIIQSNVILDQTFIYCDGLKFVYIKDGCIVNIQDNAFDSSLEVAIIPASVTSISEDAFKRCNRVMIVCPSGSYAETYAKQHFLMYDTEHYEQYVQEYNAQYFDK